MNVRDAFCRTVHEAGVAVLAAKMGANASTLQQKANPHAERHFPTAQDLVDATVFSGRPYIADAFAELAGGVFVKLAQFEGVSDEALLEMVTAMTADLGLVCAELNKALANGDVDEKEVDRIRARVYTLNQATAEFMKRVESMVRRTPPALRVAAR